MPIDWFSRLGWMPIVIGITVVAITTLLVARRVARRDGWSMTKTFVAAVAGVSLAVVIAAGVETAAMLIAGNGRLMWHVVRDTFTSDPMACTLMVTAIGVGVALWGKRVGFWRRERLRARRCPRCRYDMAALPDAGTCPECGFAGDAGAFRPYRARPWGWRLGVTLTILGLLTPVWHRVATGDWPRLLPTGILLRVVLAMDSPNEALWDEVHRRERTPDGGYVDLFEGRESLRAHAWRRMAELWATVPPVAKNPIAGPASPQHAAADLIRHFFARQFRCSEEMALELQNAPAPSNVLEFTISNMTDWPESLRGYAARCRTSIGVHVRAAALSESVIHKWVTTDELSDLLCGPISQSTVRTFDWRRLINSPPPSEYIASFRRALRKGLPEVAAGCCLVVVSHPESSRDDILDAIRMYPATDVSNAGVLLDAAWWLPPTQRAELYTRVVGFVPGAEVRTRQEIAAAFGPGMHIRHRRFADTAELLREWLRAENDIPTRNTLMEAITFHEEGTK